ncbi:uncharacterized protein LY79DRAFT_549626 [Colletotrichum navitas]|uniref:Uncharacterized protein n=1 Tax=Colletotrichum navitas TaxID=681940 RepID=A0AAD8V6J9_9PEZI|nr:uncharacterized protein LY79DRAFT_549626 [Colletotrichum navitas]KAK1594393.1 hypothetical protein LY79DRAFT_549626 [Colletotrichum navitas]
MGLYPTSHRSCYRWHARKWTQLPFFLLHRSTVLSLLGFCDHLEEGTTANCDASRLLRCAPRMEQPLNHFFVCFFGDVFERCQDGVVTASLAVPRIKLRDGHNQNVFRHTNLPTHQSNMAWFAQCVDQAALEDKTNQDE